MASASASASPYETPDHPYTQALLSASPVVDHARRGRLAQRIVLAGAPSPTNPPSGCRFHTRCRLAHDRCGVDEPALRSIEPDTGRLAACHYADEALSRLSEVFAPTSR